MGSNKIKLLVEIRGGGEASEDKDRVSLAASRSSNTRGVSLMFRLLSSCRRRPSVDEPLLMNSDVPIELLDIEWQPTPPPWQSSCGWAKSN